MRTLLIRFALWVLRRYAALPVTYPPEYARALPYVSAARLEAAKWQPTARSGMSKRHQVYAGLIAGYPMADHRHLSMAIEIAIGGGE